jgi:hypothetical protein
VFFCFSFLHQLDSSFGCGKVIYPALQYKSSETLPERMSGSRKRKKKKKKNKKRQEQKKDRIEFYLQTTEGTPQSQPSTTLKQSLFSAETRFQHGK